MSRYTAMKEPQVDIISTKVLSPVSIFPKDWQSEITADDVIDAYFIGKEDGQKAHIDHLKQEFAVNVKLATSIAEELLKIVEEAKIKLGTIHLKAVSFNSFELLFLANEESYNSDNFREAYVLSRILKNKYKTDRVHFSFSFMSESDEITNECLSADGFFMRYEQSKKA